MNLKSTLDGSKAGYSAGVGNYVTRRYWITDVSAPSGSGFVQPELATTCSGIPKLFEKINTYTSGFSGLICSSVDSTSACISGCFVTVQYTEDRNPIGVWVKQADTIVEQKKKRYDRSGHAVNFFFNEPTDESGGFDPNKNITRGSVSVEWMKPHRELTFTLIQSGNNFENQLNYIIGKINPAGLYSGESGTPSGLGEGVWLCTHGSWTSGTDHFYRAVVKFSYDEDGFQPCYIHTANGKQPSGVYTFPALGPSASGRSGNGWVRPLFYFPWSGALDSGIDLRP
jgi:hypothetical protein